MLKFDNVSVGYNGFDVVYDISMTVKKNENLCIIGPNGCGKTTLLKAVTTILPHTGNIFYKDIAIKKMRQKEISKKIALMCQTSGMYFSYSVFETVMMGRYLHSKNDFFGTKTKSDEEYVLKCLETVNLLDVKDKDIMRLSGGQLQRVFLARTLAQDPDIILLDEPTNHLDLKYQVELIEYLKEWSKDGEHTVVGVLHDLNLAMRLADKIMLMRNGRIAAHGKTEDAISGELLYDVYGIDVVNYMKNSLLEWNKIRS